MACCDIVGVFDRFSLLRDDDDDNTDGAVDGII